MIRREDRVAVGIVGHVRLAQHDIAGHAVGVGPGARRAGDRASIGLIALDRSPRPVDHALAPKPRRAALGDQIPAVVVEAVARQSVGRDRSAARIDAEGLRLVLAALFIKGRGRIRSQLAAFEMIRNAIGVAVHQHGGVAIVRAACGHLAQVVQRADHQ